MQVRLPPARDGFTAEQIDLGRLLFFDPILSGNKGRSCSDCHDPARGFAGETPASYANHAGHSAASANKELHSRKAPGLWNVAFEHSFGWDGSKPTLEQQIQVALFSAREFANDPRSLEHDLNGVDAYRTLFAQAFGPNSPLDVRSVSTALAAFVASLVSMNSRYDQYAHGDHGALNATETEGLFLFRSFVTRCSECHIPPLFTSGELAAIGAPDGIGREFDPGAALTSGNQRLLGAFRIPSLRNSALTAPYMHSGGLATLHDVVDFYNAPRGHALPLNSAVQLSWHIHLKQPALSENQVQAIIAFLGSLTDETAMPPVPIAVPSGLTRTSAVANNIH
jgi:cytochrome c peroxidase